MKIAILGDALDIQYAGVQTYLRGLLHALLKVSSGDEILVVRPKRSGEFEGVRELIVPVQKWPGHFRWRIFFSIPALLSRESPDIVVEPAHFGPFRLPPSIRRVTIIHDITPVLFPGLHPFPSGWVHKIFLPRILRKADRIIVNSRHTKADLETHYPVSKGKINVVYPGVEDRFKPLKDPGIPEKYGITRPYMLSVGTIEPRKNLLRMLKAYERYRRQGGESVQWVLVGKKGWKNTSFFKALDQSPYRSDIRLTGYVEKDDLPGLYTMSRLFVFPSLYEGFGLPVLEAMACGAPVLVSQSSSLPEVGGNAAQYFNPYDVDELAGKLQELLPDPEKRAQMGRLSLKQSQQFRWDASARQFLSAMELSVAAGNHH